jgi:mRNA-degrading endonuclease RelE of RelBE toxin-antitoxin system
VSSVAKKPCQDYQIIYDVDDTTRTVAVAVVGYRRKVYKGLDL